ncbi:MAG: GNAT family N-acetyltransferase [Desulfovibrionaceae bacterium]
MPLCNDPIRTYEALPETLRAPGLHPAYILADARREPAAEPVFFAHREAGECWWHGFHLHAVPGTDWFDVQSAYGYGGPVSTSPDPDFLAGADRAWSDWCRERNVLAEFVRFHPLLENWRAFGGQVLPDRPTVWMDLTQADILASFETRARTAVRKARKNGAAVRWVDRPAGTPELAAFAGLYRADMARLGADPMYFFRDDYFQGLCAWEGVRLAVCEAGGDLLAAALFLADGRILEYHLSAADEAGRRLGAVNLVLHEAALRGRELGLEAFHLGGGFDAAPDNPLLFFKAGFSRQRAEFRIGKRIHRPGDYAALKARWEAQRGVTASKILFYRF